MMIDLTQKNALTPATVAALIASEDDSVTRQLCVTKAGKVILIDASQTHGMVEDLLFRLESWGADNGYSGPAAAKDPAWVGRIHDVIAANWPNPSMPYIDLY